MRFFDKNKEGKIIKIALDEVTMLPELQNAFHMDAEVKDRIKADIAENGFSKAHPIHIFHWENKWVLCDGHTRFTAAKELGNIKYVWAQVHQFKSINEALLYSMKEQFNRRNIEDSELFKQFEVLRQEESNGRKLTAAEMSERLKKSKRHIFKLQEVEAKSTPEQLKAIREGEASINQVYNEIKKQEQELALSDSENATPQSEISESDKLEAISHPAFSDRNEETISEHIEKNIQEEIKKDFQKKQRELQKRELKIKQKEIEFSNQLSDKQIFLLGAKYALIQKAKGKTSAEILDSSSLDDSMKASNISFAQEDLELLKAI